MWLLDQKTIYICPICIFNALTDLANSYPLIDDLAVLNGQCFELIQHNLWRCKIK
jgi:hypothetical protein